VPKKLQFNGVIPAVFKPESSSFKRTLDTLLRGAGITDMGIAMLIYAVQSMCGFSRKLELHTVAAHESETPSAYFVLLLIFYQKKSFRTCQELLKV